MTDSGLEHLIASIQPKKHSEDYSKHSKNSKDGQPALEASEALGYADRNPGTLGVPDKCLQKRPTPAGLDYEELGCLSDLGQQDCSPG